MNEILRKWLQAQAALCVLGMCIFAWLVLHYPSRLEMKSRSDLEFATTKDRAEKIANLMKVVPSGRSQESTLASVVSRVREGLQESSIQEQQVKDIRIVGTTPIPKTNLSREDVSVGLKAIEMKELIAFVQSQEAQPGINCTGIEIRASSSESLGKEKWDVDLALTHVVEKPVPKAR